jgi:hypothetical protein
MCLLYVNIELLFEVRREATVRLEAETLRSSPSVTLSENNGGLYPEE